MPSSSEKAVTKYIGYRLGLMRDVGGKKLVSYEKIAAELGLTKPAVFGLIKGTGGAGQKVEQLFADRFFGGSIDKLRAAAMKWFEEEGQNAVDVLLGVKEYSIATSMLRYASLGRVLQKDKSSGRWSAAAVAAAQSMQLDADNDPGEAWWTETLDRLDSAIKVSIPKLPSRGVDIAGELDARPVRTARKKT